MSKQLAIIPGPHCHGPKDPAGVAAAHAFLRKLAEAAGAELPVVETNALKKIWPPRKTNEEGASTALYAVNAWKKVCENIGLDGMFFEALYMPWIGKLGSMNEHELFWWSQSGYPETIAEIQDTQA